MSEQLLVSVARKEPGAEPDTQAFEVPYDERTSVLDALDWIKENGDPSLTYRASCRSGVCGSCGVMVNGSPKLACETSVSGYRTSGVSVAPLEHAEVKRDLVVDTEDFLAKLTSVCPALVPDEAAAGQTAAQMAAYAPFVDCVNCLLCNAACPVLAEVPDFLGPAVIAAARRWDLDSRDAGAESRASVLIENEFGIWPCTQLGNCTRACPKGVDPAKAIRDYQREALG